MAIDFDKETALQDSYDLTGICEDLDRKLAQAQAASREWDTNQIWRKRQIFGIWRDYTAIYEDLKNHKYFEAWCLIEQVLINNKFLIQNFPEDSNLTNFIVEHLMMLQTLFPYRVFTSTVLKIKKEVCTICRSEISPWTDCGHIIGKVYNGKLCLKEVQDMEFLGADIVLDPEHKYSVLFAHDEYGNQIDNYDYSLIEDLMKCWKTTYQDWSVTREECYLSPTSDIKDTDPCPCLLSFESYSNCCKNRPGILTYHYTINA